MPGEQAHPLHRWAALVEEVNGRTYFGQPGVRDPENPCDAFEPGEPTLAGHCDTDGHYMCDECVRRATCEGCSCRPTQCECPEPEEVGYALDVFFRWVREARDAG